MCGRFFINNIGNQGNRCDIAPNDYASIIIDVTEERHRCRWGYDVNRKNYLIINARAESVRQKPLFGRDFLKRRCLIPANGYYEWDSNKVKYSFASMNKNDEIYLAGVYTDVSGEKRFTILTMEADKRISDIHTRMPVLVKKCEAKRWLCSADKAGDFLDERLKKTDISDDEWYIKVKQETNTQEQGIYVQQSLFDGYGI